MESTPPEGIKVLINESDVTDIQALIDGPAGTPYAVGIFRVKLTLSKDFPQTPPKAYFLTKIFHPNVAANGEICVNTLKKDWKPDLGIKHILLTIKCLLIVPNPESALNEEAGKMLLERYDDYSQRARMMTEIHAQVSKQGVIRTYRFYRLSLSLSLSHCSRPNAALLSVPPVMPKTMMDPRRRSMRVWIRSCRTRRRRNC